MFSAQQYIDHEENFIYNFLKAYTNLWEALPDIAMFIQNFKGHKYLFELRDNNIWVEHGALIESGAQLESNIIVCKGAVIKKNAVIRENCIIGNDCFIGNFVEVKNSILLQGVCLPHFNYVGDSILGQRAHMGAGAKISNFKSLKSTVKVKSIGKTIDTGLEKFGTIVGSDVEIACNVVLNPGSVIGKNSMIYPLVSFRGVLESNMIVKLRQSLDYKEKKHD